MASVVTPMTTEELLALPEDGVRRWLIDGELRESPMTVRNRFHSQVLIRVGQCLANWLDQQPAPRGQILGGEAGVRISHNPETTVGIDVGYISREVLDRQTDATTLIDGVPTLVVEILSPSDTLELIDEKLAVYRQAKVPVVWLLDVADQTVTVYRPKGRLRLYTIDDDLTCEPELPGFTVPVARLFE